MARNTGELKDTDRTARESINPAESDKQPFKLEIGRIHGIEELDDFQKEIIEHKGNIAVAAGRQVGKSVCISIKAAHEALENKNYSVMIISATERQAYLLFSKVLMYIDDNFRNMIKRGKNRPTKTEIKLTNGSIIRCLPTGLDGLGIRGYTINLLIADEAAFIPKDVWPAVTPMLATTGGKIILLSTPFGREGYFYERFTDENFRKWNINAIEVAEHRKEPQRTYMLNFQEKERERMTKLQFQQEYEGLFVSELRQLFSDDLIKKCCILKRTGIDNAERRKFYLGVDVARMGEDASSFQILEKIQGEKYPRFNHIYSKMTKKTLTTDTFDTILRLEQQYGFKMIGIDAGSGSLGVSIFDFLIREPILRKKIIALNNLSRQLDHRGERKKTLLKVDMYLNLLGLMEKDRIKLLDDEEVIESLRAIQYEYAETEKGPSQIKIFASRHKYTDLVEGLIRAAWLANLKTIDTYIDYC